MAVPLNLLMCSDLVVKRKSELVGDSILSLVSKLRSNGFLVSSVVVDGERAITRL